MILVDVPARVPRVAPQPRRAKPHLGRSRRVAGSAAQRMALTGTGVPRQSTRAFRKASRLGHPTDRRLNEIEEAEKADPAILVDGDEFRETDHDIRSQQRKVEKDALLRQRQKEVDRINDIRRQRGQAPNDAIGSRGVSTTPDNYGNTYADNFWLFRRICG